MVRIAFRTNCHAASLERNYDIFVRSHSSCLPPPPILACFIRAMLDHLAFSLKSLKNLNGKIENCYLKICVKISIGKKVCKNTCNII